MHLCLFEDDQVAHLHPLTLTRAVYDLRVGIRTLGERLTDAFPETQTILHSRRAVAGVTAQEHDRLINRIPGAIDVLFLNGRWFVEEGDVLDRIRAAGRSREPSLFIQDDICIAAWVPQADPELLRGDALTAETFDGITVPVEGCRLVSRLWHPTDLMEDAIADDFAYRTHGYNVFERPGAVIEEGAQLANGEHIYVAPGARILPGAVLNAENGPIYIDRDAVVMEQAVVRGPTYIGPHAQVKMAGIIEAVAAGTWCKLGGEVHHTIFHSYSSKPHAGFLGHSYVGRWCNFGADTNNSNLKNDYGTVTLHDTPSGDFISTGRQFFGLVMGDHSKCGINSMFNTGTVVGVFCNLYGSGFLPRYIPSFSWGSPEGMVAYRIDKALRVAEAVMSRRDVPLTDADREMLQQVFEATASDRAAALAG